MTTDIGACGEVQVQSLYGLSGSIDSTFDPLDSLVKWFIGNPTLRTYEDDDPNNHPFANCRRVEPVPYSPMSPASFDHGPSVSKIYAQWSTEPEEEEAWTTIPHITGLTITASRVCGEANYVQHGDCIVCGKIFAMIQEETTLGLL